VNREGLSVKLGIISARNNETVMKGTSGARLLYRGRDL
jgi:hypothetical protein